MLLSILNDLNINYIQHVYIMTMILYINQSEKYDISYIYITEDVISQNKHTDIIIDHDFLARNEYNYKYKSLDIAS